MEPNPRIVQPLLDKLEQAYEVLMEAHVSFVLLKKAGLDEDVHAHWMDARQREHDAVVEAAHLVLGLADEAGLPVEAPENTDRLKDEIEVLKLRIKTQMTGLRAAIEADLTSEQHAGLKEQALLVQKMVLEDYRPQCSKLRELLPEEAAALKETHDTDVKEMVPIVEGLLVTLRAKVPSAAAARPQVTGAAGAQGEVQPVRERWRASDSRQGIQMTRLDPPKFDGKARN